MIRNVIVENNVATMHAGYQILSIERIKGRLYVVYNADYDSPIEVGFQELRIGDVPDINWEFVTFCDPYYIYVHDLELV